MSGHELSADEISRRMSVLEKHKGNQRLAAIELEISRSTLQNTIEKSKWAKPAEEPKTEAQSDDIIFPDLPSSELEPHELIEQAAIRFERHQAARDARRWMEIKVKTNKPFALAFVGDPHLDNNGCNWPLLREHIRILAETPGLYATNLGDLTDNWVGRLVRLYADQEMSKKQAWKLAKYFMRDSGIKWLCHILGNHDCVTADTELLTKRGWIKHDQIQQTDMVLGINPKTGMSEWQVIQAVIVKPGDTIWKLSGARHDLACTARHRVFTHDRNGGYSFRKPPELPKHFSLPVARPMGLAEAASSDDQIKFAAWVLTDGHITSRGDVSIYQSKLENIEYIALLLSSLNIKFSHYIRERSVAEICGTALKSSLPQHQFMVLAESRGIALSIIPKKGRLPEWIWDLSERQFRVFLDEYVRGDGSWYPTPRNGGIIYGEKPILDDLQSACISHGISANVTKDNRGAYRLNICFKEDSQTHADGAKWAIENYDGIVWCLKVPHGNFAIRRNGKAHFTGNSWNDGPYLIKANAAPIVPVEDWQSRFQLVFPNGSRVRIHAAHNFPGNSIWNPMHGPQKASMLMEQADIYACGDLHNWAINQGENANRDFVYHLIRSRGYKTIDQYADNLGYSSQKYGATVTAVIDPVGVGVKKIRCFADLEESAEFLTWKRSRA